MVCRECGAYNAEHLTHCRVCAAKLRDDAAPASDAVEAKDQDGARPQREFAKAPSWPTRAYSGSVEKPQYNPPKKEEPAEAPAEKERPVKAEPNEEPEAKPEAATPAPVRPSARFAPRTAEPAAPKRYCSVCGREMLEDAPFCAYCGSHEGLPGAENQPARPAARRASAAAVPAPSAEPALRKTKAPKKDDFDDLYDDDDEYEDDETPKKLAKPAKKAIKKKNDDFDLDDDDDVDGDDEYDEDDEFDEDLPKKHGKGTTLLFWVLIVLLLALIGVFGAYIVKKNYGGSVNNLIAAVTGKGGVSTGEDTPAVGDAPAVADESKMYTAEIGTDIDATTGTPVYLIDVYAPTGSTVKIETTTELVNGGETTIPSNNHVILRVPQAALLPNEPVDSATITIQPKVSVVNPDGQTVDITVPPVTADTEVLTLTIESPEGGSVANTYANEPIKIIGRVADYTVGVFVNGEQTTVYEDGTFQADYQPKGGEEAETVTIEARKNNCMTATQTVTVEPFVMQDATLTVTNDVSVKGYGLRTDKDGKVTIQGTTVPGATITATATSDKVTFETATVTDAGEFQMNATITEGGVFKVSLSAKADGYTDAAADCILERLPDDSSSSYKKVCKSLKTTEHAGIVAGTIASGDYMFTGTVTEVVSAEPYETVKMTLSSGETVVITNRSAKNRLEANDINKKKTVAGSVVGTYEDTGLPYLWIWYVWNA